jgi:hypothetical protein
LQLWRPRSTALPRAIGHALTPYLLPPPPRPPHTKKQELKRLDGTSQAEASSSSAATKPRVFKLIGPALVAQDPDEARATVSRRLAAIGSELGRVGAALEGLEKKAGEKQRLLMGMQQRMMAAGQQQQQQQAQAAQAGGAAGQQAAA